MNAIIKKQWIAALTSGEYQQGKSQLRYKDDNYCCLGVLCELYNKEHNTTFIQHDEYGGYSIKSSDGYEATILPNFIKDWANKDNVNLELTAVGHIESIDNSLAGLNDGGKSFSEIADIIEKHF